MTIPVNGKVLRRLRLADLEAVGKQLLEINFAAVVMSIPCIVLNSKQDVEATQLIENP